MVRARKQDVKAKQQGNDGKRAREQETESVGARQQSTSSREPAPPSPSLRVRVGARDDAPLSPPAPLSETMRQYVERKLKDTKSVQLASTVDAILRATGWEKSLLEDPNNEGRLVADLEKPAEKWDSFKTMEEMKGVSKQSAVAVLGAARTIALVLLSVNTRTLCV
jgi:hypothetical protein